MPVSMINIDVSIHALTHMHILYTQIIVHLRAFLCTISNQIHLLSKFNSRYECQNEMSSFCEFKSHSFFFQYINTLDNINV